MRQISVNISDELQKKIAGIAKKSHRSFEECVTLALNEYAENFEDFYKTDLCSVDKLERAFSSLSVNKTQKTRC